MRLNRMGIDNQHVTKSHSRTQSKQNTIEQYLLAKQRTIFRNFRRDSTVILTWGKCKRDVSCLPSSRVPFENASRPVRKSGTKSVKIFPVKRHHFTREIQRKKQRKKNGETKILHPSFFTLHFFAVPLQQKHNTWMQLWQLQRQCPAWHRAHSH